MSEEAEGAPITGPEDMTDQELAGWIETCDREVVRALSRVSRDAARARLARAEDERARRALKEDYYND